MQLSPAILVSTESRFINLVQASAATSGSSVVVVSTSEELRSQWHSSSAVLIGADQLDEVSRWALPQRDQVYLVGEDHDQEAMCRWSAPLAAPVIRLPEASSLLTRIVSGHPSTQRSASVVGFRGGAGGVGTSTLSAGVALVAARSSLKVALVDGDWCGGGIDLLMGAENTPGWRWDKLRNAHGHIADITSMLPTSEGITLVSMERTEQLPAPMEAFESVVDSLMRCHDLVIIDSGRDGGVPAVVKKTVVVAAATVRALASTKAGLISGQTDTGLVVRRGGTVTASQAARVVGLPLLAVVPTQVDLPRLADRGIPPYLGGKWRKTCTQVLDWCVGATPKRGLRW